MNRKKLIDIYEKLISHKDKNGNQTCEIFLELPSKEDYPDYYEVITDPIALDKIKTKIDDGTYTSLEDFRSDMSLMVQNAKTFNPKGSWVVKNAVALMKVFEGLLPETVGGSAGGSAVGSATRAVKHSTTAELGLVPPSAVLSSLLAADSIVGPFEELPDEDEYPEYYEVIKKPISLAEIKERIDTNEYRSIYDMEVDIVLMVDNAKTFNEPGSEIFASATELLAKFYQLAKIEKNHGKFQEDLQSLENEGETYHIGDFAYFTNEEDDEKPIIGQIYRLWKNSAGNVMIQANWYLRPEQTVHPATRKFFQKEVFKYDKFTEYIQADLIGKCVVLYIKDYMRGRPTGWTDQSKEKNVWVCESRYIETGKRMERIKNWRGAQPEAIRNEDMELEFIFDKPLVLEKVPSPFVDGSTATTPAMTDEAGQTPRDDDAPYVEEPVVPVKRKRGRPRKDQSLAAQQQPPAPPKVSLREKQQHQQQQAAAAAAQVTNPNMMAQYQQMQMRNYAMYSQQYSNQHMMNWISAFSMQAQAARAMAPPSRQHRVTRSIAAVRQALPEIVPAETAQKFRSIDGRVCWFAAPPFHIPPPAKPAHSTAYLLYRKRMAEQGETVEEPKQNKVVKTPKRVKIREEDAMNSWAKALDKFSDSMKKDAISLNAALTSH